MALPAPTTVECWKSHQNGARPAQFCSALIRQLCCCSTVVVLLVYESRYLEGMKQQTSMPLLPATSNTCQIEKKQGPAFNGRYMSNIFVTKLGSSTSPVGSVLVNKASQHTTCGKQSRGDASFILQCSCWQRNMASATRSFAVSRMQGGLQYISNMSGMIITHHILMNQLINHTTRPPSRQH